MLRQPPVGAIKRQRPEGNIIAVILRIEGYRPAIVIRGIAACMIVLFKMLADKIELIAVVNLFRHRRRAGRFGQGRLLSNMFLIIQQRLVVCGFRLNG